MLFGFRRHLLGQTLQHRDIFLFALLFIFPGRVQAGQIVLQRLHKVVFQQDCGEVILPRR